jgi:hypothetical protein
MLRRVMRAFDPSLSCAPKCAVMQNPAIWAGSSRPESSSISLGHHPGPSGPNMLDFLDLGRTRLSLAFGLYTGQMCSTAALVLATTSPVDMAGYERVSVEVSTSE